MLKKSRLTLLSVLFVPALIAGCGGDDGGAGTPVTEDGPATLAPSDSLLYAEGTIAPDATRADAINSIASSFGAPGDVGPLIISELEKSASDSNFDLDFETDIQPWLGERAGLFVTELPAEDESDAPAAFAIETTDPAAAQEFLDKTTDEGDAATESGSFEGVDYTLNTDDQVAYGTFGDFVLAGNLPAFQAAVSSAGSDSLAESGTYTDATAKLDPEALGSFFLDTEGLIQGLQDTGQIDSNGQAALDAYGDALKEPVVGSLDANAESVFLDVIGPAAEQFNAKPTPLLSEVPGDSSLAFGVSDLGGALGGLLDTVQNSDAPGAAEVGPQIDQVEAALGIDIREDILDVLGDVAVFANGVDPASLRVGAVIEATDPTAAARLVDQLSGFASLAGQGGPPPKGADSGFTVANPDGSSVAVAVEGDRIVVAVAPAGDASGILGELGSGSGPDLGADLLGEGFDSAGYVDIEAIGPLAEFGGAVVDKQTAEILNGLGRVVFGSKQEGDDIISRVLLEIQGS